MFESKKGIGPVVATALLLVVAVVSIVGFGSWYEIYSSSTFVNVEQKASDVDLVEIISVSGDKAYVKNSGTSNVSLNSVEVGGNICTGFDNLSPGINTIDISSCLSGTGSQNVVLITDEGVVEKEVYLKDTFTIPEPLNCTDITNGLVGLWHFENNLLDSSINSNDGTAFGDTSFNSNSFIGDYSVEFDGNGDYVDFGNTDTLFKTAGTTVSYWAYMDAFTVASPTPIVLKSDMSASGFIIFYGNSGGYEGINFGDTNGNERRLSDYVSGNPFLGSWHHVVITKNSSAWGGYVNGTIKSIAFGGNMISLPQNNYFGHGTVASTYFDGRIDEVAIYDRVLSSSEVLEIYNGGVLGKQICDP